MKNLSSTVVAMGVLLPALYADAAPIVNSGSYDGLSWYGSTLIVGQTSTATAAGGGDPLYFAPMPQYSGVVDLIMDFQNGSFICSGSLLPDRRSILTAAHCIHPDASTGPLVSTTAYFYGGPNPDTIVDTSPSSTAVPVSAVFENPAYLGTSFVDQNDIAVLRLSTTAPSFASSYDLSSATDLTGQTFNVAGYGDRSDTGGAVGDNLGNGRLRQGDNRYDYRMGDPDFGDGWTKLFGKVYPLSLISGVYLADFDNGLAANDAACVKLTDPNFPAGLTGSKYCDLGLGADEVMIAGGDSGGPEFDSSGRITSITSFRMGFGTVYGDFDNVLNSSWGEFAGLVPVSLHRDFIEAAMAAVVPAPNVLTLLGLGLAGLGWSRRRK